MSKDMKGIAHLEFNVIGPDVLQAAMSDEDGHTMGLLTQELAQLIVLSTSNRRDAIEVAVSTARLLMKTVNLTAAYVASKQREAEAIAGESNINPEAAQEMAEAAIARASKPFGGTDRG